VPPKETAAELRYRLLSLTYQLLTDSTNYTIFSTTRASNGSENTANNIENIHNVVHVAVGGYGHMTYPELAGFDPIFFLHHW
jgi:tyrosinase